MNAKTSEAVIKAWEHARSLRTWLDIARGDPAWNEHDAKSLHALSRMAGAAEHEIGACYFPRVYNQEDT